MTTYRWRCTTCRALREPGDALPPLAAGLFDNLAHGKCAHEKGRPNRTFRREEAPDLPEGERRKEEGQARADGGWAQRDGWTERFDAALTHIALTRSPFTSEDVTTQVGMPPSGSSPSVVGSRMIAAAKRGLIRKTGRMVKAHRPNQHAALLTEWRGA